MERVGLPESGVRAVRLIIDQRHANTRTRSHNARRPGTYTGSWLLMFTEKVETHSGELTGLATQHWTNGATF